MMTVQLMRWLSLNCKKIEVDQGQWLGNDDENHEIEILLLTLFVFLCFYFNVVLLL